MGRKMGVISRTSITYMLGGISVSYHSPAMEAPTAIVDEYHPPSAG